MEWIHNIIFGSDPMEPIDAHESGNPDLNPASLSVEATKVQVVGALGVGASMRSQSVVRLVQLVN